MSFMSLTDLQGGGLPVPETEIPIELLPELDGDIEFTEDGGAIVHDKTDDSGEIPIPADLPFDANLAEYISESDLNVIGSDILAKIRQDYDSNREWRDTFNSGLKYLGFKPENRDNIFSGASGAWDTKLTEALVRFHAEIFAELWPADGPMKPKIIGQDNEALRLQADRVANWSNYYLTRVAREYYDDSDVMLNYVLLAGSAFRKAYICPILRRPVLRYIAPNQVAIPYTSTGIYDAPRFTHINDDVQERDLLIMQLNGYYLDVVVGKTKFTEIHKEEEDDAIGIEDTRTQDDEPYTICETITDYDLPRFEHLDEEGEPSGLPLPYKICVAGDGTVLRIERNWDEKKQAKDGLYIKKLNVSQYKFMPGFGALGIGLIHCLVSSADTRTKIKRMLQDSGVFSNFPPTIRVKGMRMEHNDLGFAPGANMEIDTGGMPINNAIQQMAVKEPSAMLYQLGKDEGEGADRLIGNMDIAVGDGRQDAPVGTTLALLAAAKKPQNGVMKRMHRALTHELEMLYEMFGQWLPEEPYPYPVAGDNNVIMRQDFDDRVNPIPVSDPNMMSQTERVVRTETVMRIAGQLTPQSPPYQIEAARRMFVQLGVDDVEKLLPPLPAQARPLDPVSENMAVAQGIPLKAFIEQNHDAHIAVHTPLAEGNPALQAHITEHQAMKYKVAIENMLGFALPPDGATVDHMVQEKIAMLAAAATEDYLAKLKAQQPPPPPSMEEIMVMDVEQKREKERIRHETKMEELKLEEELAMMKSDDMAAERAVKLDIAQLKAVSDLSMNKERLETAKHKNPA